MSKYSGKCFKCGRVLTRCECNKQQPKAYATELQSEQEKRKEAEDMAGRLIQLLSEAYSPVSRLGSSEGKILAASINRAITEYNNYKAKKDGTVNR